MVGEGRVHVTLDLCDKVYCKGRMKMLLHVLVDSLRLYVHDE